MANCTWMACYKAGHHEIAANDDSRANLCHDHEVELNAAVESGNENILHSTWIKAQGGAVVAARRLNRACRQLAFVKKR